MKTTVNKTKETRVAKVVATFVMMLTALFMMKPVSAQVMIGRSIAVSTIDVKGLVHDPVSMGNLVRMEVEKMKQFRVLDKYEQADIIKKKGLDPQSCYGKSCLVSMGKALEVDYILTGSAERFGEKIVITLRLVNVGSQSLEKSVVKEFANIQPELQKMSRIALNELFGVENDKLTEDLLASQDGPIRSKHTRLNLSGPRMGVAYISGDMGQRLQDQKKFGGFDAYPLLSQFGYQFETQYMTNGKYQALLEYVIVGSGLDQGLFIPSFTFLNGFRNNNSGWEVAFGPVFGFNKEASGFFMKDENGVRQWYLQSEWYGMEEGVDDQGNPVDNPHEIVDRMDRRGIVKFNTGWVWSLGKTFRSGHLNIPVNAFVSPSKDGWYAGMSVGFNMQGNK